jgi:uncharacterized membrane protein
MSLTRYFLRGLLVLAPLAVTAWAVYSLVVWTDELAVRARIPETRFPGAGLLLTVVLITLVGFLASNFLTRWLFSGLEQLLGHLPLVKLLYTSIRDLVSAVVGDKKRFDKPVLVELFPLPDAKVLGFVTRSDLEHLGIRDQVAVYVPQSYNFAGNLVILPPSRVTPIAAETSAVMTFIVSGGVSGA